MQSKHNVMNMIEMVIYQSKKRLDETFHWECVTSRRISGNFI